MNKKVSEHVFLKEKWVMEPSSVRSNADMVFCEVQTMFTRILWMQRRVTLTQESIRMFLPRERDGRVDHNLQQMIRNTERKPTRTHVRLLKM